MDDMTIYVDIGIFALSLAVIIAACVSIYRTSRAIDRTGYHRSTRRNMGHRSK